MASVEWTLRKESIKSQEGREYNHVHTWDKEPIKKVDVPKGKLCNPDFNNFCVYLAVDYCLKFDKWLHTDNRMSMEFCRQKKCEKCSKSKGNEEQLFFNL